MAVEEKNRKIDNYEKEGGRALPYTNQMMRITANKNPTRDYTIGSNVLGVKDAQHEICTLTVAKKPVNSLFMKTRGMMHCTKPIK